MTSSLSTSNNHPPVTFQVDHCLSVPSHKVLYHTASNLEASSRSGYPAVGYISPVRGPCNTQFPELRDLSYEERLQECGLTTLETRRLRGDQIEVFKILNGYENIDRNMFFSLKKDSRTRGHEVKLVKDQCRLDIRKHSFSQRTINEWNKLSTDCVTASSVNMFKNKVDTYLRRAGYK